MSNPLSTDLRDYVKVYDNVVSADICQQLIQQFEAQQEKHEVQIHTVGGPGRMVQANFMTDPGWDWANKTLVPTFVKAAQQYRQDTNNPQFPARPGFEAIRLKRYLPNGLDSFPLHVDAADLNTARRFLIMFLYLNDVAEGGETTFPDWGIAVKPQTGRLLMFPPFWLYPHAGEKPVSGPKYIVGTYLHYI